MIVNMLKNQTMSNRNGDRRVKNKPQEKTILRT